MPTAPALALDRKTGLGRPTADPRAPRSASPHALDDGRIRLVGIPLLGVVIPNLTGFFGPLGPSSPAYWLGYAWSSLISALLWQGNRWFLLRQRRRYDWSDHRWRKAALLLGFNVLYTAAVTLALVGAWYRIAGFAAVDRGAMRAVTLTCVVTVVFVTHVYETVHLIQQRESGLVAVARLEKARADAELLALKGQIDPHFLFNSLHALAQLIPKDPVRATRFTQGLADVYRYILTQRERDLVPLADELAFAESYVALLRLRFGDAVRLVTEGLRDAGAWLVPPVSLQVLLENAVKHNAIDEETPLEVRIVLRDGRLEVTNLLRSRTAPPPSARVGLANLQERYRWLVGEAPEVRADDGRFTVVLPLVRAGR